MHTFMRNNRFKLTYAMRSQCVFVVICMFFSLSLAGCGIDVLKKDPLGFLTPSDKNAEPIRATDPMKDIAAIPATATRPSTMGLNLETYFSQKTDTQSERFERLEKVVAAMHKDLKALAPPVGKFVGMQKELQKHIDAYPLVPGPAPGYNKNASMGMDGSMNSSTKANTMKAGSQPQSLFSNIDTKKPSNHHNHNHGSHSSHTPPMGNTKTVKSVPSSYQSSPAPGFSNNASGATMVKNLRTGIHSNKIRVVLDVNKKTNFNVDLDNGEKLLVVDMPNASWQGMTEKNFTAKNPLIQSYKAQSTGQGTMLVMQLKKPTNIIYQKSIPALSGGGQRVVVDLSL